MTAFPPRIGARGHARAAAAILATLLAAAFALATGAAARSTSGQAPRRSAVLFIGDGMGPAYVTATRLARGGSAGRLHLDDLPYTALVRTYAADGPVTDSAAAATAMACGAKTVNGVLGQDRTAVYRTKDGAKLETIAIWAARRGMRVGVVTTARVTHATPAAFYASDNDRDHERAIARAAIGSPLDLLLGGGREFFLPGPRVEDDGGWAASDAEDLRSAARGRGWTVAESAADLRAVVSLRGKKVLGLFADSHLPFEAETRAAQGGAPAAQGKTVPTIVEMTRWAIGVLKAGGRPFFLMVEGGRIDHAGHSNWARTLVDETAAFDGAVGAAISVLDPKTTLVLVTADHETGGLAINGYPEEKDGIWSTVRPQEGGKPYPVLSFMSGPGTHQAAPGPLGDDDARPSGIALTDAAHTGVDVALYGWGVGAEQVRGTLDNTAIYGILRATLEGRTADRKSLLGAPR